METLIHHLRPLPVGEMYGPRRNAAVPAVCDRCFADPQTGVAPGVTRSRNVRSRYRCSMCPAIHINSRTWLRSSSTHEPSDPPLRVVYDHLVRDIFWVTNCYVKQKRSGRPLLIKPRCQVPLKGCSLRCHSVFFFAELRVESGSDLFRLACLSDFIATRADPVF